jgi:hypothetical protein
MRLKTVQRKLRRLNHMYQTRRARALMNVPRVAVSEHYESVKIQLVRVTPETE